MLEDTIVAANTGTGGSPSDIGGDNSAGVVGTYDLVGTGGAGGIAGGTGDIVLTNLNSPVLAPLGSYGGPTETMPLLPGSAAIGTGTAITGVTSDQRGLPIGATPDIGAFQVQTGLVVNTTIDGTGSPSGDLSLRQAVNLANVLDGAETITFDSTVFASAADDHADAGPARAEQHDRDGDDHRPGGRRDGQRRRDEPGVPGRRGWSPRRSRV